MLTTTASGITLNSLVLLAKILINIYYLLLIKRKAMGSEKLKEWTTLPPIHC